MTDRAAGAQAQIPAQKGRADILFTLASAQSWISTARLVGDPATAITGVCTDSRRVQPGDLFVALRGERFDAHDFAEQVVASGAAALLVQRADAAHRAPALVVPDTRRAYGELGAGWRMRFAMPLISVTGSNGKTTVKEMISAVLAHAFGASHRFASPGNLNNDIGVPASLLMLRDVHRAAVLELGMNHPGEIAALARMARPTVALVNNAQREHQEFMGSVRATAIENGASLQVLAPEGVAVFPGDDPHTELWRDLAGSRPTITFGLQPGCTVWAAADARPDGFEMHLPGQPTVVVSLSIAGQHNVRNALAAAACCTAIGLPGTTIAEGLAQFQPVAGRLVRHTLADGAVLIDDTYNANPDSVRAAIDVLAASSPLRVLVLGDMGEVGDEGPLYHREVGEYARRQGVQWLFTLGDAAQASSQAFRQASPGREMVAVTEHFADLQSLLRRLAQRPAGPATLLVKGSRFMKMERVVTALLQKPSAVIERCVDAA
jgi:UDP-N-acetylmuramoyl-tripeptide--D-alanyl-D-alanine ligase